MRIDVVEDGSTFEENALIKVMHSPTSLYLLGGRFCIEVAHLNGAPGIYSARYAGQDASRQEMCEKLLKECYGAGNRDAQYQAVMALRFPDQTIETFCGIVRGSLAHEMNGEGGFGYDPIFIPEDHDVTFAEMAPEDKHALSHRYQALMQVKDRLTN